MKNLAIIACISEDGGLGKDGDLLWHIPEDMQFFKQTTMGGVVVMGRKTFESIGRALPGRENLVLSRSDIKCEGVRSFKSKAELDEYLSNTAKNKFIIGGSSLYEMYLPEVDKMYLTKVAAAKPADVYFPKYDESEFTMQEIKHGEYQDIKYQIFEYQRKAKHD